MVAEYLDAESELFCTLRLSLFTLMASIVPKKSIVIIIVHLLAFT